MKACRILITTRCNLSCSYCCNKLKSVRESIQMSRLGDVLAKKYDIYNITGGEPTLEEDKLIHTLGTINLHSPEAEVYLYTNGLNSGEMAPKLCKYLSGVNIGCHKNVDFAICAALTWKDHLKNVRFHIEDTCSSFHSPALTDAGIRIKKWKRDQCDNNDEDRYII